MAGAWYLDRIDRNTPGSRDDVSPLFADGAAFAAAVEDLGARCDSLSYNAVAGIDALGFALGAALASRVGCGLILVRKVGKLPVPTLTESFTDYSGTVKVLELRADLVLSDARLLVVDEWIETGAQVTGAIKLMERAGGLVAGIACLHADDSEGAQRLAARYSIVCLSGVQAGAVRPR
jgi:adenine phosphoribosyltransferase